MARASSLLEFLIAAGLLVLTGVVAAAAEALTDDVPAGAAVPPIRAPRLGAPRTPPPPLSRFVPGPPKFMPRPPSRAVIPPAPTPAPRGLPPRPAPAGAPLPGAPRTPPPQPPQPRFIPGPPKFQPPSRKVNPPAPTPAPRALPPRLVNPPAAGAGAPRPSPQLGFPARAPVPAPAPAPRGPPPRSGKPAPAPLPTPQLGDPLPYAPPLPAPAPSVVAPGGPKVPALLAFGDSIADTGNNNHIITVARANFPPYGKDFPGHKATGRFSDGKLPVDFMASALGLKEFLPPYLQHDLSLDELRTGVSFASAGSGYNNNTCLTSPSMTMERQLQLFREYKTKVGGTVPEKALYVIVSGSNDIVQHFTWADGLTEPDYADIMAQRAISFVESLIGEGARQIAVAGAPLVGCIPSQRRIAGGVRTQCATDRNQLALLINRKLSIELSRLSARHRGTNIFFVDMYSILADLMQRYDALGFKNGKDACCGFIGLAAGPLCNVASRLCEDPSKYVFWDSYHPTERAYKLMVDDFMTRYSRYIH